MSNYETHIGKLKIVDLSEFDNDTERFFEFECRSRLTSKTEDEIQEMHQNSVNYKYRRNKGPWQHLFEDLWYDFQDEVHEYYAVNGIVYENLEDTEVEDSLSLLTDNGDGTFDYIMTFYNGGTCLSECIEDELEKLNKK